MSSNIQYLNMLHEYGNKLAKIGMDIGLSIYDHLSIYLSIYPSI